MTSPPRSFAPCHCSALAVTLPKVPATETRCATLPSRLNKPLPSLPSSWPVHAVSAVRLAFFSFTGEPPCSKGSQSHPRYPREVVKIALQCNAAAMILVHNHPSGDPEPSEADRVLTQKLKEALSLVGVRTLDHIVVGRDGCNSMAELGVL
ncbi:JAB domain-containing protein [Pseudomonas sp. FG1]|uniref:JAB domain-containing protein n=1 Tax=Pseudomonas sp. FG1 TaxID=3048624 RepID=UPI002AB56CBE|nr:JAB domain-containing protein [Pseudomonas sp. FG1]MDY7549463.1 JAB domain-containing protein [Pseudomonas sp. FG1]MEB0052094.1 JAB domain-containing protein [Pseudomonas sp. FG1]